MNTDGHGFSESLTITSTNSQMYAEVHIKTKLLILLIALSALILAGCQTVSQRRYSGFEIARISPEIMKILDDRIHFTEVHSTNNLPPGVLALCYGGRNGVANPGENWNPTDVISEDLPYVQLDWGASNGNYYIVHYGRGGFAPSSHAFLAEYTPGNRAKVLWRGMGFSKSYNDFLFDIRRGKYYEDARSTKLDQQFGD